MVVDWGAIGLLVASAGMLYASRQMTLDNKESLNTLVQQNREDHRDLFHKVERETVLRMEEDGKIRENFVRREECDRRHAQRRVLIGRREEDLEEG